MADQPDGTQPLEPATSIVISQAGSETVDASGAPLTETGSDGSVYSDFSTDPNAGGQDVPHHVRLAATNGQPATDQTITYNRDGTQTFTGPAGSETVDASGAPLTETGSDGSVYSDFSTDPNAGGQDVPHHVRLAATNGQPATEQTITYNRDGTQTFTGPAGSETVDASGAPLTETDAAGDKYSNFSADPNAGGRDVPHAVVFAATDDQPASTDTIAYNRDGTQTFTGQAGSETVDASGAPLTETDAAGDKYSNFSADPNAGGRNVPHAVVFAATNSQPASTDTIAYNRDGTQTFTAGDGSATVVAADGSPISETDAAGDKYSNFSADPNAGGRNVPHAVVFAATNSQPASTDTIAYNRDGTQTFTAGDGSATVVAADGSPISETDTAGDKYSNFSADPNAGGRNVPHTVVFAATDDQPASTDTITYNRDGTQTFTAGDGSATVVAADGSPISETDTAGDKYSNFSADPNAGGRDVPHAVVFAATDDQPASTDTITYNRDGSETFTDQDGHSEQVYFGADGQASKWISDGWTYTNEDGHVHGVDGNESVDIYQMPNGITAVAAYENGQYEGTTLYKGQTPYYEENPDGTGYYFAVEIPKLGAAIGEVTRQYANLASYLASLKNEFTNIVEAWKSPSGTNYENLVNELNTVSTLAQQVVEESITMMQTTYKNYTGTEAVNAQNFAEEFTPMGPTDGQTSGSTSTNPFQTGPMARASGSGS